MGNVLEDKFIFGLIIYLANQRNAAFQSSAKMHKLLFFKGVSSIISTFAKFDDSWWKYGKYHSRFGYDNGKIVTNRKRVIIGNERGWISMFTINRLSNTNNYQGLTNMELILGSSDSPCECAHIQRGKLRFNFELKYTFFSIQSSKKSWKNTTFCLFS